ncbi:hypothetical protein ADUPG1_006637 [Aduncisulcus paluster]|uniref:Uncharacterized protein n=1 Tax=Aduncisulcus paluster TaxID=2918883 RepID=A0ABQ5KIZ7_9EUKA|nr:hypothetical protein ADUPG1_006637 [Aduncisulcus paluster]|eukprot:gnl/Carplike_NY0171/1562_a2117_1299.p1 GENE.gnl/Carplike_NY0171/1562_a2117_1299~~gnl/Carplike_NY0171/1562_a2117_1299.p1  ORF type:complete len:398 (-),score=60.63 gnl/Carplike_NY0171/1562_a2117_1299:48-1241(-)
MSAEIQFGVDELEFESSDDLETYKHDQTIPTTKSAEITSKKGILNILKINSSSFSYEKHFVTACAFHSASKVIAIGYSIPPKKVTKGAISNRGRLCIFNVDEDKNPLINNIVLPFIPNFISAIPCTDQILVVGTGDEKADRYMIYNLETNKANKYPLPQTKHDGIIRSVFNVSISDSGKLMAMSTLGRVIVVHIKTNKVLREFRHDKSINCTSFSSCGGYLYCIEAKGNTMHVWNLKTGKKKVIISLRDSDVIHSVSRHYNPTLNIGRIVCGCDLGISVVYDEKSMHSIKTASKSLFSTPTISVSSVSTFSNLTTALSHVAIHPSGSIILAVTPEKRCGIKFYDLQRAVCFSNFPTQHTRLGKVTACSFSPNGRLVVCGCKSGHVAMWRLRDWCEEE